jgi:hypothetical protein
MHNNAFIPFFTTFDSKLRKLKNEEDKFTNESETALGVRNWKSGVQASNAHCGHFRACHCDGDADDDGGAMKTLIQMEIDP